MATGKLVRGFEGVDGMLPATGLFGKTDVRIDVSDVAEVPVGFDLASSADQLADLLNGGTGAGNKTPAAAYLGFGDASQADDGIPVGPKDVDMLLAMDPIAGLRGVLKAGEISGTLALWVKGDARASKAIGDLFELTRSDAEIFALQPELREGLVSLAGMYIDAYALLLLVKARSNIEIPDGLVVGSRISASAGTIDALIEVYRDYPDLRPYVLRLFNGDREFGKDHGTSLVGSILNKAKAGDNTALAILADALNNVPAFRDAFLASPVFEENADFLIESVLSRQLSVNPSVVGGFYSGETPVAPISESFNTVVSAIASGNEQVAEELLARAATDPVFRRFVFEEMNIVGVAIVDATDPKSVAVRDFYIGFFETHRELLWDIILTDSAENPYRWAGVLRLLLEHRGIETANFLAGKVEAGSVAAADLVWENRFSMPKGVLEEIDLTSIFGKAAGGNADAVRFVIRLLTSGNEEAETFVKDTGRSGTLMMLAVATTLVDTPGCDRLFQLWVQSSPEKFKDALARMVETGSATAAKILINLHASNPELVTVADLKGLELERLREISESDSDPERLLAIRMLSLLNSVQ